MTSPVLQATTVDEAIASPRSTVLSNPKETAVKTKDFMTTDVGVGGMNNDTNVPDAATAADVKVTSSKETSDAIDANGSAPEGKGPPNSKEVQDKQEDENREFAPTPVPQAGPGFPGYPSHLTPQPMSGYYQGYGGNLQVTPEPPSPGGGGHPIANAGVYDTGSFFQQHGAFAPSHTSPFGGPNVQQLSPPRGATNMVGSIPPASPLFPRVNSANGHGPPSPNNLPYMSPPLGSSMYQQSYPVVNHANSGSSNSPDEANAWGDRNQQNAYQQNSPQMSAYGMPMTRAGSGGRAYSFEETMLPPSAALEQDPGNPAYSPYGGSQSSPGPGGTLFALPQPWGYGGPPPDMYNPPGSPLQPRPTAHPGMGMPYPAMGAGAGGPGMRPPAGPYGQFFPASSPGPPIQTTASNKGPDGANLFIFHIPNHFTNIDMYQLFCPYGNLLSVRIMVERDTGRSRGFGFVSYDSPESAASAIKELNGFAIGNKRLKVQHKQIRQKDMQDQGALGDGNFPRQQFSSALPPSGPMAAATAQNLWYDNNAPEDPHVEGALDGGGGGDDGKQDEGTDRTSNTSSGAEAPLGMGNENAASSPLANLGTLQSALPEVTSGTGPSE